MTYDPLRYSAARSQGRSQVSNTVTSTLSNAINSIDQLVKRKDAEKQLKIAYDQSIASFVNQAKEIDPMISDTSAKILAMKAIRPPVGALDVKTNFQNLLAADAPAQKLLDQLKDKKHRGEAQTFTQSVNKPIEETSQVRAEGPPVPSPTEEGPPAFSLDRIGEVPMERQTTSRPMRESEFESGFRQLSPEAQKYVPEGLGSQISGTEQIFQQPLKTFEGQRSSQLKEREGNIKTMTGIDKDAGYRTAIIESKDTVESLNTKKKTLGSLIKTVTKMNNLPPRQTGDKGTAMQSEIDDLATQLDIPAELANNPEFLGRVESEIDRLIDKETQQQEQWNISLTDYKKRQANEAARKRTPRPATATPDWKLGKELQTALKDMTKQQFPNLYKVIEGEYGIEVMKQTSGIADAARAIMSNPKKRIALAYAFPEEVGSIAQAKGSPRPSDTEIQSVLSEMQRLQDQVYGVIQGTSSIPTTDNSDDLFSGLGDL